MKLACILRAVQHVSTVTASMTEVRSVLPCFPPCLVSRMALAQRSQWSASSGMAWHVPCAFRGLWAPWPFCNSRFDHQSHGRHLGTMPPWQGSESQMIHSRHAAPNYDDHKVSDCWVFKTGDAMEPGWTRFHRIFLYADQQIHLIYGWFPSDLHILLPLLGARTNSRIHRGARGERHKAKATRAAAVLRNWRPNGHLWWILMVSNSQVIFTAHKYVVTIDHGIHNRLLHIIWDGVTKLPDKFPRFSKCKVLSAVQC